MEDRGIPFNEAISIRLLLSASSNTTFKAYPTFSDSSIIQKVEKFKGTPENFSSELS